ncbi:MAG: SURF1 family protein [Nitrosomonas sp.]|nr:MAG: SURF1 family protein [Nitrosomonas sp.]
MQISVKNYCFKSKVWAVLVSITLIAVFISLGNWQLSRAAEKNKQYEELILKSKQPPVRMAGSLIKLQDYQFREIEAYGEFINDLTIYIDNKVYQGRAGYHVITPFKLKDSNLMVAVNRGWIAVGNDRRMLPKVIKEHGEMRISGMVISPEIRALEFSKQDAVIGPVWSNFSLQRIQAETGFEFQPLIVLRHKSEDDGLVRDWVRPDSGATKNMGYAVQWFSLAATTLIIFIVLNVKRNNQKNK